MGFTIISNANYVTNDLIGKPNGICDLDGNTLVPTNRLPAIAITDVYVVASTAERDELDVQEGDVCKVTGDITYIYDGAFWIPLNDNNGNVTSVNTILPVSGNVTLTSLNITENTNLYHTSQRVWDTLNATATSLGDLIFRSAVNFRRLGMGTVGQILSVKNDGTTLYEWIDPPTGTVQSVNSVLPVNGDVSLTTTNVPEGNSLYFTSQRVTDHIKTILTSSGDLLYRDANNTIVRLPIGTNGQILKISSLLPSWQDESGGTVKSVNNISPDVNGNISLTTNNISENTNLYFTTQRVTNHINTLDMDSFDDVNYANMLASGQILKYDINFGEWRNALPLLMDNDDVNVTNPSNGQVLTYQNGDWINSTPTAAAFATLGSAANDCNFAATISTHDMIYRDSGKWTTGTYSLFWLSNTSQANALTNGDVLTYNSTSSKWENIQPSAGSSTLADLTDVNLGTLSDYQYLYWDDGTDKWVNGKVLDLEKTSQDVSYDTPPNNGMSLLRVSGKWSPRNLGISNLTADVLLTNVQGGQSLVYDSVQSKWVNGSASSNSMSYTQFVTPTSTTYTLAVDQTQARLIQKKSWTTTTLIPRDANNNDMTTNAGYLNHDPKPNTGDYIRRGTVPQNLTAQQLVEGQFKLSWNTNNGSTQYGYWPSSTIGGFILRQYYRMLINYQDHTLAPGNYALIYSTLPGNGTSTSIKVSCFGYKGSTANIATIMASTVNQANPYPDTTSDWDMLILDQNASQILQPPNYMRFSIQTTETYSMIACFLNDYISNGFTPILNFSFATATLGDTQNYTIPTDVTLTNVSGALTVTKTSALSTGEQWNLNPSLVCDYYMVNTIAPVIRGTNSLFLNNTQISDAWIRSSGTSYILQNSTGTQSWMTSSNTGIVVPNNRSSNVSYYTGTAFTTTIVALATWYEIVPPAAPTITNYGTALVSLIGSLRPVFAVAGTYRITVSIVNNMADPNEVTFRISKNGNTGTPTVWYEGSVMICMSDSKYQTCSVSFIAQAAANDYMSIYAQKISGGTNIVLSIMSYTIAISNMLNS